MIIALKFLKRKIESPGVNRRRIHISNVIIKAIISHLFDIIAFDNCHFKVDCSSSNC